MQRLYGLCPQAPTAVPAAVAPAVTPVEVAERFWQTIPLPSPHPVVPPGYAITGKPAYLVTDGSVAPNPFAQTTVLGPLSVVAHGSYTVNWGDGTTTGPFASESKGYPSGQIVHTYDNVGTYTITVTETWSATWRLGAADGVLDQLQTGATIPNFQVRQVQAVITGG